MRTRREIESFAATHGFRAEIVEKVARLVAILRRMSEQEALAGAWVLKGGTALNLFHLELPRLSVDIDVNYIGHAGADAMRAARPSFERVLTGCCEREGCSVLREPHEHAGGKFRLRFPSAFTASSNLEVDVSYVARVPLLGVESRRLALREVDEALMLRAREAMPIVESLVVHAGATVTGALGPGAIGLCVLRVEEPQAANG